MFREYEESSQSSLAYTLSSKYQNSDCCCAYIFFYSLSALVLQYIHSEGSFDFVTMNLILNTSL